MKKYYNSLIYLGGSLTLVLPMEWIKKHNLDRGDVLTVECDNERPDELIIRIAE